MCSHSRSGGLIVSWGSKKCYPQTHMNSITKDENYNAYRLSNQSKQQNNETNYY
jgi:hypothetical protein